MKFNLRDLAYASVTVAALTAAGHFASRPAGAQSVSRSIVGFSYESGCSQIVVTETGDVWRAHVGPGCATQPTEYLGNIWNGTAPTAAKPQSWGGLKIGH